LLLLSKVTQKHFRQPYRLSKVPLRPAGGKTSGGRLFCTDWSGAETIIPSVGRIASALLT